MNEKYIQDGVVEKRDYQEDLLKDAIDENSLIILPTGLGKTTVALGMISKYLEKAEGAILFLAPTKVLANQHRTFLERALTIDDIVLITGEISIEKREKHWVNNSVICATPEIARNDLERNLYDPKDISLVIFDEAHRGVGDYAYCPIAGKMKCRILGMTATLPSEINKVKEITKNLKITKVVEKTDQSPDVTPYIQETKVEYIKLNLYSEMKEIQKLLQDALNKRYKTLKQEFRIKNQSLGVLLRLRQRVLRFARHMADPLFAGIKLHYGLNIFEAHGVTPFLSYIERSRSKKPISSIFSDPGVLLAIEKAKLLQSRNIEHSKLDKLMEIIPKHERVLIFTSYRDSVLMINNKLKEAGIKVGMLIGKAGKNGLKQDKQVQMVDKFRDGEYQVLIATRVGEEGLDIADVNWVIFYDNVPSSIRHVQRRGRTGRQQAGNLIVLIAKDTIDEVYFRISHQKIKQSSKMGKKINFALKNATLDEYESVEEKPEIDISKLDKSKPIKLSQLGDF